jgi:hypothetical protein
VERLAAVTHLSYTTDIDNLRLLVLWLSEDGVADISSRSDIGAEGRFRTVVGLRRHHTTYVEDDVGTCDTTEDIIVVGEVTPDDF